MNANTSTLSVLLDRLSQHKNGCLEHHIRLTPADHEAESVLTFLSGARHLLCYSRPLSCSASRTPWAYSQPNPFPPFQYIYEIAPHNQCIHLSKLTNMSSAPQDHASLAYFQTSPVRGQLEPYEPKSKAGWRYLQCTDTPNELKVRYLLTFRPDLICLRRFCCLPRLRCSTANFSTTSPRSWKRVGLPIGTISSTYDTSKTV